jgi:PAS domain-containing protein
MENPSHRVGRNGRRYRKKPVGARRSQAKNLPGDLLEKYLVNAHIGVAQLDRTYRVMWVNEAFARLVNRPVQELVDGNFLDLFPDDQLLAIFDDVITSGSRRPVRSPAATPAGPAGPHLLGPERAAVPFWQ